MPTFPQIKQPQSHTIQRTLWRGFAAEIRKRRVQQLRSYSNWQWHLDEVFVKVNGETHYLWRAVDHEGEVLETTLEKYSPHTSGRKVHLTLPINRVGTTSPTQAIFRRDPTLVKCASRPALGCFQFVKLSS